MKLRKKHDYYKVIYNSQVISEIHFNFKQFLFGIDFRTQNITFLYFWFLCISLHHNKTYKNNYYVGKYFFDKRLHFSWKNITIGYTFFDKKYSFFNLIFLEYFYYK